MPALVRKDLWVRRGLLKLPGAQVPFWGFAPSPSAPPVLPGPVITATAGDVILVTLRNTELPVPVSLMFPGQTQVLTRRPATRWKPVSPRYEAGRMVSLTDALDPGTDDWIRYQFRAGKPGVYLYQSGTNPGVQVQMGLYGLIVVRPLGFERPSSPNYRTAYGARTGTGFDIEKLLVLGEVDTAMHARVAAGAEFNILDFAPEYWVINGRSYPDTDRPDYDATLPHQPLGSAVAAKTGQRILLRLVNAGFLNHTVTLGGLHGRVVAEDAFPLASSELDTTYEKTAVTLGAGQSVEVIVTPGHPGEHYLRARDYLRIVNVSSFPGGMMTRLLVTA
ncbi:MAG: ferroxidase [Firmicutes bacterium]|nr:ferroxidase [Bacillota bacterium]